jgi:putative redox protein
MSVANKSSVIPIVVRAEGTGVAQRIVTGGSRAHVFETDAYAAFGGREAAPSPLAYALGALSSCNQITATLVAKGLGIHFGKWTFEVQGDLDTGVLVAGAEGNANFQRVVMRATVETDATEEQFATLVSETERRCPASQLFKRSGLELVNEWTRVALRSESAGGVVHSVHN